jgi:nucleoside-diphosphate-sugar epimerase
MSGISGFLGTIFAERLVREGYEVHGFLRRTSADENRALARIQHQVVLHYGNLLDRDSIRVALRDARPDVILHLGAVTRVAESFERPFEYMETNALGTMNLAEAAKRECPELKKFVMASSVEVYGNQPEEAYPTKETLIPNPDSPYGVAKQCAENYLRLLWKCYKFPCIILRQANTYGRTADRFFVIESIITQMLESSAINLGDPHPERDFLHVDDLIEAHLDVLRSQDTAPFGDIFNISTAEPYSIERIVGMLSQKLNWNGQIRWHTRPVRPGEIRKLSADYTKARKTFGWQPTVSISEGLDRAIAFWSQVVKPIQRTNT